MESFHNMTDPYGNGTQPVLAVCDLGQQLDAVSTIHGSFQF